MGAGLSILLGKLNTLCADIWASSWGGYSVLFLCIDLGGFRFVFSL